MRDLRRLIIFMVTNGFSLLEVRKLYTDELQSFYDGLIYTLEKSGKIKEGSYAKITKRTSERPDETVESLRAQMMKAFTEKK